MTARLKTPTSPPPHTTHNAPLQELGPIRLFVACDAPDGDPVLNQRHIGSFAQVMLRIAHIPLATTASNPNSPRLQITIRSLISADLYSVYITLELLDRVWLVRPSNEDAFDAATWRAFTGFMSSTAELRSNLRDHLGKLLASFMNEYLAANNGTESI